LGLIKRYVKRVSGTLPEGSGIVTGTLSFNKLDKVQLLLTHNPDLHFFVLYLGLGVEFLLKTDGGYPRDAEVTLFTLALRVEFLLKTESGYLRDAEVT